MMASEDFNFLLFDLNSSGGDVVEAMKIGRFAREMLVRAEVIGNLFVSPESEDALFMEKDLQSNPDKGYFWKRYRVRTRDVGIEEKDIRRCYSACILIFYGATMRGVGNNVDKRKWPWVYIPTIGLHRPFYEAEYYLDLSPQEAQKEYNKLKLVIREYLEEMGAPRQVFDRMFRKASNDIELINAKEFKFFYQEEEAFLEEWIIARCGDEGLENVLTEDEIKDFDILKEARVEEAERIRKQGGSLEEQMDAAKEYLPDNFNKERARNLSRKVRSYFRSLDACRDITIKKHQTRWGMSGEEFKKSLEEAAKELFGRQTGGD